MNSHCMSLQMERAARSCTSWFCCWCSISTGVFGSIDVLCNRVVLLLLLRLSTVALWFEVSYAQQPGGVVVGYYQNNGLCNADVEGIVTGIVSQATQADPTMPAGLLRLMFHDCWVEGCDGSILLDPSASNPNPEKTANPSATLRGFNVIDQAKSALEAVCPQTVSCADIVALAARDAVVLTGLNNGGLELDMPTGRLDGLVSSAAEATALIVSPQSTAQQLIQQFEQRGFSQDEMITLSGAHTIGQAHCNQVVGRLYNFPGSANGVDPTLDPTYAAQLQAQCPANNPDPSSGVDLDPITPFVMDNNYYRNGVSNRAVLASDTAIFQNFQTQFTSNLNSNDEPLWEQEFGDALVHLASLDLKSGNNGEIRVNCRMLNAGNK
jgi:peroxidase